MLRETTEDHYEGYAREQSGTSVKYLQARQSNPDYDASLAIVLSMADMEFRFPKFLLEKAIDELPMPMDLGYSTLSSDSRQVVADWVRLRYCPEYGSMCPTSLIYWPGVLHAYNSLLRAVTCPGDGVLIFSPNYYRFFTSLKFLKLRIVEYRLRTENNRFYIDFEELEQLFMNNSIKLVILCSPHNPTGRIWNHEELQHLVRLIVRYKCIVFSDEIYSDSIEEEEIGRFVSLLRFKEVWPWLVYANSFTKAYNCSGNGSAYTIVFNKELNNKLSEQQFHNFYYPTVFSTALMKACYGYGAVWLKGVNKVVRDNYNIVKDYFGNKMSTILVYDLDCSYLMLLDFKNVEQDGKRLENRLKVEQIYPTYLTNFFAEEGAQTAVRFNLACGRSKIIELLRRMTLIFSCEKISNDSFQ